MIVLEFVEQTVMLSVVGVQNREDEKIFQNLFIIYICL